MADLKANGNIKAREEEISNSEKVSKKKKKAKNNDHAGVEDEPGSKSLEIPKTEVDSEPEEKTKEKKKTKKSVDSSKEEVNSEDNAPKGENGTDTQKKKKKKKHQNPDEITTENDAKNSSDAPSEKHHKSNDKKKANNDVEDTPVDTKESKKRKRASAEDDTDKVVDASPDDKSNHFKTEEANGSAANKSEAKLGDTTPIDGVANPNGGDKSSGRKSAKKPRNGSAEPTTVKAFQRVKVDEIVIKDERLKDNSYWAKDGAESGYGAKAQEILGQVRGKDFRHEKTKKKRGSYRGGHIDFDSHSVKFNDSDDE